ncbi:Nucleotide sugar synthetase-like protein [Lactococcus cremoris]|uniref:Nucleotide sugar synthetase-like protein n=1 Tax=Lactococcus lactis subsp. cremoris TaxID=1359 RepID=A0A166J135_LACLC|nr:hypothetical protein [Lactococcus cremoris]KZK05364.1 Nucleotide sugar synthetase-like protein [Lactococcus cremoris]
MTNWVVTNNSWHGAGGYPFWGGAGGKARFDFEETMVKDMDFKQLSLGFFGDPKDIDEHINGVTNAVKTGDIIFLQFPQFTSVFFMKCFIEKVTQTFGAKVVAYIHDVLPWRDPGNYNESARAEFFQTLSLCQGLIVHSDVMKNRLDEEFKYYDYNSNQVYIIQKYFGYRANRMTFDWKRKWDDFPNMSLDYAGNLDVAQFLNQLPENININVYGENKSITPNPNINLMGNFDSEAITHVLKGDFGLVWKSTTYPYITGLYGEYEKINAPHKLSMYLAADLPVIVSSQSAMAKYVKENNIGIVIDSLEDLPNIPEKITKEDYNKMVFNVNRIGNLIRSMFPAKWAVMQMIDKLDFEPNDDMKYFREHNGRPYR